MTHKYVIGRICNTNNLIKNNRTRNEDDLMFRFEICFKIGQFAQSSQLSENHFDIPESQRVKRFRKYFTEFWYCPKFIKPADDINMVKHQLWGDKGFQGEWEDNFSSCFTLRRPSKHSQCFCMFWTIYYAVQSQKAVYAYYTTKQILPFGFAYWLDIFMQHTMNNN